MSESRSGDDEKLAVAERLFAAITAGDIDGLRDVYSPDAVIWHNHDGLRQTVEENLTVLRWVTRNVGGLRYDDVRRQATTDGFVQQHVLRGTTASGRPIEIPACIVCTVSGRRITRLDEYLDSAHIVPLLSK